jgi:hypothetical protein
MSSPRLFSFISGKQTVALKLASGLGAALDTAGRPKALAFGSDRQPGRAQPPARSPNPPIS